MQYCSAPEVTTVWRYINAIIIIIIIIITVLLLFPQMLDFDLFGVHRQSCMLAQFACYTSLIIANRPNSFSIYVLESPEPVLVK